MRRFLDSLSAFLGPSTVAVFWYVASVGLGSGRRASVTQTFQVDAARRVPAHTLHSGRLPMQPRVDNESRIEQLMRAHENERSLIVSNIHDGIIQYVASAIMHLETARFREGGANAKVAAELARARELLCRSMDEARAVMSSILPPILDEKGLVAAIEHLVEEHRVQHLTAISFVHEIQDQGFSPLIEVALFRVAQQGLANIWQHSQSSEAVIELKQTQDQIHLSVADSGVGFKLDEVDPGSTGIRAMQNRIQALSGELTIESSERGTRLCAVLPTTDALEREHLRRKQAEEKRVQAERRLELALRATSDAMWDCDLETGEVYWNEGYDELFGERPPETKGSWQWWIDHIHPGDRDRVVASLGRATKSDPEYGDRWSESYRYARADGAFISIKDQAFIARDETGKPIRMVGCMLALD